jgi:hypothetical protein
MAVQIAGRLTESSRRPSPHGWVWFAAGAASAVAVIAIAAVEASVVPATGTGHYSD